MDAANHFHEMEFHHVGQAGLKLLTSSDPLAMASQSAGITCVKEYTDSFEAVELEGHMLAGSRPVFDKDSLQLQRLFFLGLLQFQTEDGAAGASSKQHTHKDIGNAISTMPSGQFLAVFITRGSHLRSFMGFTPLRLPSMRYPAVSSSGTSSWGLLETESEGITSKGVGLAMGTFHDLTRLPMKLTKSTQSQDHNTDANEVLYIRLVASDKYGPLIRVPFPRDP
ncbi:hypothetical protein AAY473_031682 [Plecturocebus cupreus]